MKTILITGASGLIGTRLSQMLKEKKYNVKHLSRGLRTAKKFPLYLWKPETGFIDPKAFEQTDVIIHLAGVPLDQKRWSAAQKTKLLESRSASAYLLWQYVTQLSNKPECFISASGTNYYGSYTRKKAFTEEDPCGTDFLAKLCQLWETNADLFCKEGIRTIKLRTGMVLSREGGALKKIEKMTNCFLGASLGSGRQYMPWIHIDDLCGVYIKAIEDKSWEGPYNAVAPETITNLEFTKILAKILHRPLLLRRIPGFVLKGLYGKDFAKVLLNGSCISPQKVLNKGFSFRYPKLKEALEKMYP